MTVLVPIVFYDHNGFAAGVDDGEPSFRWPSDCRGEPDWNDAVTLAGPPLYGEPMVRPEDR